MRCIKFIRLNVEDLFTVTNLTELVFAGSPLGMSFFILIDVVLDTDTIVCNCTLVLGFDDINRGGLILTVNSIFDNI